MLLLHLIASTICCENLLSFVTRLSNPSMSMCDYREMRIFRAYIACGKMLYFCTFMKISHCFSAL